jgi:hypothetical protein
MKGYGLSNTSGAIQFIVPTVVLVLVLASSMMVATPKSPESY